MRKLFLILFLFILPFSLFPQISQGGFPPSFFDKSINPDFDSRTIPPLDMEKAKLLDEQDAISGGLYLNGRFIEVNITTENAGTWQKMPDNSKIWRLRIQSKGALALAVYYDNFRLPPQSRLFLYNDDRSQLLGAFTEINNPDDGLFANEFIEGDAVILEYVQPAAIKEKPVISISKISYAYRDIYFNKSINPGIKSGKSGACMVNINCPAGSNWQNQKRGVARIQVAITTGTGWCTGSLVNNSRNDCTPYFLTADHCTKGISDLGSMQTYLSQWVFYFNYEYSGCSSGSPSSNTMTGATFKALADPTNNSDFILMQLKQAVPQSYNPYFNGWSRSEVPSTSGACIHHPSGDVKKINTYSTSLISAPYYQGNPPTHWIVYWATGAVEGGSSGSPIFNSSGKLIGTLTGGTSSCDNPNNPDGFGKFSYHWNHLTSSQNRLREWLDPDNVDFTEINGSFQPCSSNMNINANFKANETNIAPGTTVNFTDYSIGHPTSWAWTFTGGSPASSTAKNPSVTYNNPGIYPVTLKASNTSSSNIMSKSAYITVNSGVCKKINYPINGNIGVLSLKLQDGTFWGYVSGNNKGDDKIKANIFNFDSGHPYILGAYFLFGIAKNATNPNITFGLWSKGINGKPALLMATGSLPMAAIADDVANKRETYVQFNYPQKVTSSYFIGVYLPSKSGDTLAIKSNKDGDTNPGIAWEQWVDDSWHAYSEKGCWDIDIANAIYPFACDEYTGINNPNLRHNLLNINIFPNPAYDAINISFGKNIRIKAEITLFNPEGICVIKQNLNKLTSDYRMNIKDLAAGLYYLNINCSEGNITRKISVMNR